MARSGLAAVKLLLDHGAQAIAMDTQPLEALPEVKARLEEWRVAFRRQTAAAFEGADGIVLSPGVPVDLAPLEAARQRGVPVIGEVELAGYFLKGPGWWASLEPMVRPPPRRSPGTSSPTAASPARWAATSERRRRRWWDASRWGQWNVLELSSFQLETIDRFRAAIAACINVTPDHLDRHHTYENYANAKRRLFETQTPGGFAILNADNETTVSFAAHTEAPVSWFSQEHAQAPRASGWRRARSACAASC